MLAPDQMQPDQYYHPSQISLGLVSAYGKKRGSILISGTKGHNENNGDYGSGNTVASETWRISSKRAASCLWRPLVSTIMRSHFSFLNLSTPSTAILTGSDSL